MSTNENLFLKSLYPINYGEMEKEDFDSYYHRVSSVALNIPEDVLYDWIYRHFNCVVSRYSSLDFEKMKFVRENWSGEDIYQLIKTDERHEFDIFSYQLYEKISPLQRYVLEHKTWPLPIIVLENKEGQHSTRDGILGQPFHLLEGHLRLDYFRRLYREVPDTLPESHPIWKVTIEK